MRLMLELKIFMHALRIDLSILGLIREFKHSNSNMRYQRLNSKGSYSLFLGHSVHEECTCSCMLFFYLFLAIAQSDLAWFRARAEISDDYRQ